MLLVGRGRDRSVAPTETWPRIETDFQSSTGMRPDPAFMESRMPFWNRNLLGPDPLLERSFLARRDHSLPLHNAASLMVLSHYIGVFVENLNEAIGPFRASEGADKSSCSSFRHGDPVYHCRLINW